ncbi:MAG: 3-deoxy-8-phosphooctulonate synthase [Acidiferrobacterales bacterium]|nr:3-deoxy-8-phosphooctulonate synthase [Acidiferrobacterales bacterium]
MKIANFKVGLDQPFFLIAGPCVIESREFALETAKMIADITGELGINTLYKSSFDKANRTSGSSFRGPGIQEGLDILAEVREQVGIPVLTDVHTPEQVDLAAKYVDMIQTPAFLCRQTDLIEAVGRCGIPANIKKGQFLSPQEMINVTKKAKAAGGEGRIAVCERGASFGYNNLVVDMRGLAVMRNTECPVVFDATHSVQLPGGQGDRSGGQREFVPVLARAAVAAGVSGLFMETHPDPTNAKSDGPNAWPTQQLKSLLSVLKQLDNAVKTQGFSDELL